MLSMIKKTLYQKEVWESFSGKIKAHLYLRMDKFCKEKLFTFDLPLVDICLIGSFPESFVGFCVVLEVLS